MEREGSRGDEEMESERSEIDRENFIESSDEESLRKWDWGKNHICRPSRGEPMRKMFSADTIIKQYKSGGKAPPVLKRATKGRRQHGEGRSGHQV